MAFAASQKAVISGTTVTRMLNVYQTGVTQVDISASATRGSTAMEGSAFRGVRQIRFQMQIFNLYFMRTYKF